MEASPPDVPPSNRFSLKSILTRLKRPLLAILWVGSEQAARYDHGVDPARRAGRASPANYGGSPLQSPQVTQVFKFGLTNLHTGPIHPPRASGPGGFLAAHTGPPQTGSPKDRPGRRRVGAISRPASSVIARAPGVLARQESRRPIVAVPARGDDAVARCVSHSCFGSI